MATLSSTSNSLKNRKKAQKFGVLAVFSYKTLEVINRKFLLITQWDIRNFQMEKIVLGAWSWAYRSMYIPDIYQNDRDEELNQKKIHAHDHAHGHASRTKLSL